jgi:ribose transport system substrate-binding protein
MLRTEGIIDALVEEFGLEADDPKIVHFFFTEEEREKNLQSFADLLASYPEAVRICASAINEEFLTGGISVLKMADRWDPDNTIIVTYGVDEIGRYLIRRGITDAGIAYFPERYGEYVVPAVCTILEGHPVPPYIFVETEVITKENIDTYYPDRK